VTIVISQGISDEMTSRLAQCRMDGVVFGIIQSERKEVQCIAYWAKPFHGKPMNRTQADQCEAVIVSDVVGVVRSWKVEGEDKAKFLDACFSASSTDHETPTPVHTPGISKTLLVACIILLVGSIVRIITT
jgi:hypothetical protein